MQAKCDIQNYLFRPLFRELLGPALLAIHNLHHYSAFFRAMGRAIEEGEFERVRTEVLECYERDPPRHREEVVGNGVER